MCVLLKSDLFPPPRNRYGLVLTGPVLVMAKETCTGEMPSFDPRSCSEAKKRPFSSDGSESLYITCSNVALFVCLLGLTLF